MEAAAKVVDSLANDHRIRLPTEPHHLSYSPDWKYRYPPDPRRPFEEWYHPRLQYATFCSDADRGVLLTRPAYDMREELIKPAPKEINALARVGEKKKLSLSDYKNKKTATPTAANTPITVSSSTSPPIPNTATPSQLKRDGERGPSTSAPTSLRDTKGSSIDVKRVPEARRLQGGKPTRDAGGHNDGPLQRPRENVVDRRYTFAKLLVLMMSIHLTYAQITAEATLLTSQTADTR